VALPKGGKPRIEIKNEAPDAIYFPSCTNSLFGPTNGGIGTSDAFIRIVDRANLKIGTPEDIGSLCCGTPWKSKGLTSGYQFMQTEVANSLKAATRNGKIPIVCDASSCTEGLAILIAAAKQANLEVLDAAEFISERALPKLTLNKRISSVTIHKTCANVRSETDKALKTIASAISETVIEPLNWSCCAFAGDRGLLHPELTASATKNYAAEILNNPTAAYVSTNKTCEIGMSRATSNNYRNILELLEEVTR
jgi:D-lactate dehydrogenase